MTCTQCGEPTKKSTAKFCSTKCKVESQKGKRLLLDETKKIKCKVDGKIFKDYLNRSGALTEYSNTNLNKEFSWGDWEVFSVELKKKWKCPHCSWSSVDVENKSGWITTHLEKTHGITPIQHCENYPVDKGLWKTYWQGAERLNKIEEHEDNRIKCLECGNFYFKISNTHLKSHNLTEEEYKVRYGIDSLSSWKFRKRMSDLYYQNDKLQSPFSRSKYEQQLCDLLTSLDIEHIPNHKKFGFDVDIYIPSHNLAIEFDGLYYHSQYAGGKTEYYHLNKTKECEKLGIHLIHILEDEWVNKEVIVVSRLKNLLGKTDTKVHARKCDVRAVDYEISSRFLEENHLQGKTTTSKVHIGLFLENTLVGLMTFGMPRNSMGNTEKYENEWEMQRFCNKLGMSVVGGAGRLLSYFENNYIVSKLVSFADRRWTSSIKDSLYDGLGFTLTSLGSPNYWYLVEPMKRTHRFTFTKQKILDKFKNADPNLSEWDNMIELGFDRIWDCGSLKYEKVYNDAKLSVNLSEKIELSKIQRVKKKRKRKETTRNIIDIQCKICMNSHSIAGIASHFKLNHGLTVQEYVEKYGEYRPEQLRLNVMLESAGEKFKCKICNELCRNEKHLTTHLTNIHNIEKLEYVKQYILNGNIPLCKCGCGNPVKLQAQYPYHKTFLSGHN